MARPAPKTVVTELAGPLRGDPTADLISSLMRNALRRPAGSSPEDYVGEVWSAAAIGDLLAMPGVRCLVASIDDIPTGYLLARLVEGDGEILSVGVSPAYRRQGMARTLLSCLRRAAVQAGTKYLYLEVAETNEAARACYLADGWREIARRAGYYDIGDNKRLDALVFSVALTS